MTTLARSAVAGLALGVLLVGCGGKDPEPPPEPSASGTSESAPTQTPTTDPTGSTGTEPTPTEPNVTPAAGLLLQEATSQLNTPVGEWELLPEIVSYVSSAGNTPTAEVITLSDKENFASPATLDEQVRFLKRTLPDGAIVERQPDVVLDGAPAYYVQWYQEQNTRIQHDIGLDHGTQVISIHLDLDRNDPAAAEALVASVLASFRWR